MRCFRFFGCPKTLSFGSFCNAFSGFLQFLVSGFIFNTFSGLAEEKSLLQSFVFKKFSG